MINQEELSYINTYLLKSGERIDFTNKSTSGDSFFELKIIKQTERTLRVVGLLIIAAHEKKEESAIVADELLSIAFTPKKKVSLNEHEKNTMEWFNQGFILKEIRFKKDGKTPDVIHYRMSYWLYKYQQNQIRAKEFKIEKEFSSWKGMAQSLVQISKADISNKRDKGYHSCLSIVNEICQQSSFELKEMPHFPSGWSVSKRIKFLHFILAFLHICFHKNEFDWKEIGASYYKEIGGSKEFDQYKDVYINQLEEWTNCPAARLGMTSLGKITPLYFSGQITGLFSDYRYGPVHSLTDLSIAEEEYTTNSTTLWLVENRAILTRLAAAKNFLEETDSLVVCIDGHLRSSHKNCIQQLLTNGMIQQVLIWSDYDLDGFQIAKEVYLTVSEKYNGIIKWITHTKEVLENLQDYEAYMQMLLKDRKIEQEQVLGGANEWKKWIKH
jgi:hypothetical protein